MHYIELYIFALDLYLNSLNHFIWKRIKVTVCGRLPLSRYANTWFDHDDVSIGLYCALLAPQWKANFRSTSVQVMNTWPLIGYSITRLESQNRKFAPILIVTRVESFCEKRDSSRVTIFLNVTRVKLESPKIVTRVTLSLLNSTHSTTALDAGMQRQDKAYVATSKLSARMPFVLTMQKYCKI